MTSGNGISRRDFLKLSGISGLSLASIRLPTWMSLDTSTPALLDFPQSERLGRVIGGRVAVKLRPDIDSPDAGTVLDDDVVVWLREIVGKRPLWYSQRFVETPDGYIYSPNLQQVRNLPNQPLTSMADGEGFWAEVTVPYVDLLQANPPPRSPWLKGGAKPRLYYSQVMWIDAVRKADDGLVMYQLKEKYGTFGDIFWADARAFRPIQPEETTPLSPQVENKRVVVRLNSQSLSCYEGDHEVYYCRVSTGGKWDIEGNASDEWATPPGSHTIWRKLVSVHMTGGSSGGGYDLCGIGWTTLFSSNGVAVHSTFWHNSYGIPKSRGCVNCQPDDAHFVWRWTNPEVPYNTGDVTISGMDGSTKVVVSED